MIGINQKKFEEVLINLNLLSKENIEKAKIESIRTGQGIEEAIISLKLLDEEDVIKAVAISSNVPYVNLIGVKIDDSVLQKLPREYSKKYMAVPFGEIGSTLNVAMENPNNIQAIEFIERLTGKRVSPYMASRSSILEAINQQKDLLSQEVSDVLKSLDYENKENIKKERKSEANINQLVQDAPVTRAVNTILEYAVKSRASDIHIEPWEKELKIRYRIDGVLHETMTLPTHIHSALISRIKILSDLKIDEHRMPQDGRFNFNIEGQKL